MTPEIDDFAEQRAALERSVRSGPGTLDARLRAQAMDDPDALPPALAAYAGQVALDATGVDDSHFAPVRAAGVSEQAIVHAPHVAYLFRIINRFADALDFEVGDDAAFAGAAKILLARGYKM